MKKVYCGECEHYQGIERVLNPKSAFHEHVWRVKCAIGKSKTYVGDSTTLPDSHWECSFYVPSEKTKERTEKIKALTQPKQPTIPYFRKNNSPHADSCNWCSVEGCTCGHFKEDTCSWWDYIKKFGYWKALKILLRKIRWSLELSRKQANV